MSQENLKVTLTINPKVNSLMRRQAFNANLTHGEVIALYQNAYLEKLEREKAEKKLQKELKDKGEVTCPKCNQPTHKLAEDK